MKNKFLTLEWFKSTAERAIEKVVADKLVSLMNEEEEEAQCPTPEPGVKLYHNLKLVNDTLTVVMRDGSIVSKASATEEDYFKIRDAVSEKEIINIMASYHITEERLKDQAIEAKNKVLQKGIQLLKELSDFEVEGGTVKFRGTGRTLPQLLVEKFIEIVDKYTSYSVYNEGVLQLVLHEDDDYMAHKNFFMWCCLNPRAEVADELYRFLTENSFKITKQGFFVALRNVVTLHGSPELVHFVSNAYNKVKAVWKKNPNEYTIFLEDGEYKLVHDEKLRQTKTYTSTICPECDGEGVHYDYDEDDDIYCENCDGTGEVEEYDYTETFDVDHGQKIGGLTELYLDLPNREENRFTDNWTNTFDIRVGQVVSMPSEDCNWSTQDCAAAGLHFAGYTAPYVLCGDTTVMTLHNPMKVVGIGAQKGRCWEYLPFMLTTVAEADQIMNDRSFDFLQLDEQYAIRELESLAEKAQSGFTAESKKHEFNLPHLSSLELRAIVGSLEDMKNEIVNRVVNLD